MSLCNWVAWSVITCLFASKKREKNAIAFQELFTHSNLTLATWGIYVLFNKMRKMFILLLPVRLFQFIRFYAETQGHVKCCNIDSAFIFSPHFHSFFLLNLCRYFIRKLFNFSTFFNFYSWQHKHICYISTLFPTRGCSRMRKEI